MKFYAENGPRINARFTVTGGSISSIQLSDSHEDCFTWEIQTEKGSVILEDMISGWMGSYSKKELPKTPLPLAFDKRLSPFTRVVLATLEEIPFGKSFYYQEVGLELNRRNAARAVGSACGRNPFPLVIPCHRVLGKGGGLGGFSCGLPIKEKLLRHEGIAFN